MDNMSAVAEHYIKVRQHDVTTPVVFFVVVLTSLSEKYLLVLQLMKEKQPEGPYCLVGYSFGACVAFEMCLQLESRGERLRSVSLLDGSHAYVSTQTKMHESSDTARDEATALYTFAMQFACVDYNQVRTWICAPFHPTDIFVD